MADGCLLNGHLRPNKYFCKMSTSPDLAEQLFAAFPLSGRSVGIVMCFWGSSVDQKFGTNTVCHLDIYNVLSGNGRSAGGVVRVRWSSIHNHYSHFNNYNHLNQYKHNTHYNHH